MLQSLGRGSVGNPVLLVLIQVLDAFQDNDHGRQAAGYPDGAVHRGHHRQRGGDRDLQELEPFIKPLVVAALDVVPADLVLQPVPCRV